MKSHNSNKPVYAYVPIGIGNLDEMLSGTGLSKERMFLFFHQLFLSGLKMAVRKDKNVEWLLKDGWVSADTRILRKFLGGSYINYINWCEERGLIERRRNSETGGIRYSAGKYCQTIRINNALLHKEGTLRHFKKEAITEHKTLAAIARVRQYYKTRREASDWYRLVNDTHIKIVEMSRTLKFRINDAEGFLTKRYKAAQTPTKRNLMRYYLQLIESINDDLIDYFSVDVYGHRLHFPISGLWKPLRTYMFFGSIPDEPLAYVDISSSQIYLLSCVLAHPALLAELLPEFAASIPALEKYSCKADIIDFHNKCCSGTIYQHFTGAYPTQTQITPEHQSKLRDRAKKRLISFLYSNPYRIMPATKIGDKPSEFKAFFLRHYPSVYEAISVIKAMDEKEFPFMKDFYEDKKAKYSVGTHAGYINPSRIGQLLESRVVLGMIAPEMIQRGVTPFATVHDAFIVPKSNVEQTKKIINERFGSIGLTPPQIKTTEW